MIKQLIAACYRIRMVNINKVIGSVVPLMLAFALLVCFPQNAKAKEDLTIPDWVVNAQLFETGDLQIVEDITFEFNDEFNGVFREIILDKTSGISDIQVWELTSSAPSEYIKVQDAKNGDSDVFLTEEESEKSTIQIF